MIRQGNAHLFQAIVALLGLAAAAWGQGPPPLPSPPPAPTAPPAPADAAPSPLFAPRLLPPAGAPGDAEAGAAPAFPAQDNPGPAPAPPQPWLQRARFDATGLAAGGGRGFGTRDLDAYATFALPTAPGWAPLLLTPDFTTRFWQGPRSDTLPGHPDLPSHVYDTTLDIGWRPRLAQWLFADLGVTPGLYGDFHRITAETFRPHGRALAIVAFSEKLQVVAGLLYINRLHAKVLPAGGVIWQPDEGRRFELVFPQPKASWRFATVGGTQWWGYVLGEFGGGTWTVQRAHEEDLVDYTDLRLIFGVEWVNATGLRGRLEAGYSFHRTIRFSSATPEFSPDGTLLLRAGIGF